MRRRRSTRAAFSLVELMAVVVILAIVAKVVLPRLTTGSSVSKKAACETEQGNIEVQCELWRHNTGNWPAANLSDISANLNYFPTGVPACPYDGTTYTIDTTGRVVGHNH